MSTSDTVSGAVATTPGCPATLEFSEIPMGVERGAGWAALRDAGPIVQVGDIHYVTRRDDVVYALRNPQLFSSEEAFDFIGSPLPLVPLTFDPPEHTRFRKILQPFFSPRALGRMLPALQAQAVQLIDDIAAKSECEVIADVAMPYPSQVFLTLFGLPLEDRDQLIAWKDLLIHASDPAFEGEFDPQPAIDLSVYLDNAIRTTRENPSESLLSQLLQGDPDSEYEPLDDGEALGLAFLFVMAGLDTVTAVLGFALATLAQDRELRATLVDSPDRVPEFVEEIVRLEPSAPSVPRMTTEDVELGGVPLPKGTMLHLALGAINREDGLYPTPDEVVLDGKLHKHWGFGGGAHRCLGSHLARMELTLVITEWLKRIPEFTLADDADLVMPYPASLHGLTAVKLVLGGGPQ